MRKAEIPFGVRTFEKLADLWSERPHRVFEIFVQLAACALSMGAREEEYLAVAQAHNKDQMMAMSQTLHELIEAMEKRPFVDLLGPIHMEIGGGLKHAGEFYTPPEVCKLMAEISVRGAASEFPLDRPVSVMEPCCGGGQMCLSTVEAIVNMGWDALNIKMDCSDINKLAVNQTFVNLTLHGVPAVVRHQNVLSLETWGTFTTPWWPMATAREPMLGIIRGLIGTPEIMPETFPTPTLAVTTAPTAPDLVLDKKGQFAMEF